MANYLYSIAKKLFGSSFHKLRYFYKAIILRDPQIIAYLKWLKDGADALRFEYPLTENSIVFDVGGYIGEWSEKIVELYDPFIHIFEPVPEFQAKITTTFDSNPKISSHNFVLHNENATLEMAILDNSSSIYREGNSHIDIFLKDIYGFLEEHNINSVDLIKINIEGGEYPLLQRLIETNTLERFHNILVQFHPIEQNSAQLRNEIRESLRKTHFITFDYPFIWENWQKLEP